MMRNTSGKFGVPKTLVALLVIAAIVVGSAYFFKFGAQTLVGGSPGQPAPTPAVTDFNACKHFTVVGSTSMSGSTQGVPGKSVELAVDYGSASDVTDPQFYASRGWLVNSKSSRMSVCTKCFMSVILKRGGDPLIDQAILRHGCFILQAWLFLIS